MCRIMEELERNAELRKSQDVALLMLKDGLLPIETISRYSGLSVDDVKKLATQQN